MSLSNHKYLAKHSSRATVNTKSKGSSREINAISYNEEEKGRDLNTNKTKISLKRKPSNLKPQRHSSLEPIKSANTRSGTTRDKSEVDVSKKDKTIDETKYYINYEGKLAFRKTKSVSGKFLATDDRIETATYILNMIFSQLDSELDKIGKRSISPITSPSSTITFHSTKFVPIKERIKSEKKVKLKGKEQAKGIVKPSLQNGKNNISKIVQYLRLPINVAKPKPFLDSKVDYDLVLSDKDRNATLLSHGRSKPDLLSDQESDFFPLPKTESQRKLNKILSPFVSILWF